LFDFAKLVKFRTWFDHVTLDVPLTVKVNGSKIKVTALHDVSASNIQARISCRRL